LYFQVLSGTNNYRAR